MPKPLHCPPHGADLWRVRGKGDFKVAKRIRDTTRDAKLYELAKMYTVNLAPAWVGGKLLTGAQLKVMSVANLEKGMRQESVL